MGWKRREFIAGIAAVAAWPGVARAQHEERVRRVGVIFGGFGPNDPELQARVTGLKQGMQEHGWIEGRNAAELLNEVAPAAQRIAVVFDPAKAGFWLDAEKAATGKKTIAISVATRSDLEREIGQFAREPGGRIGFPAEHDLNRSPRSDHSSSRSSFNLSSI